MTCRNRASSDSGPYPEGLSGDGGIAHSQQDAGWLQPGTNRILVPLDELDNVVRYALTTERAVSDSECAPWLRASAGGIGSKRPGETL